MTAPLPYPGLRPFRRDETDIFFGREEQTDELLEKLGRSHFLAVVGPSGCGKSSLVRAGMIAGLETGFMASAGARWRVAELRPGSHPLKRLAKALTEETALRPERGDDPEAVAFLHATLRRGPLGLVEVLRETPLPEHTNLLVLVDQFEEIFRYRTGRVSDESDAFVALLLETAKQQEAPIYVVLTMRSDFLGHCALFTGLPEAMNDSQYLTPRLTRDQRQAAIVGPARVYGGDVEPALVNRLLNEMGADPDQLPLMQHLLMRMWTRSRPERGGSDPDAGRVLTLDDYEAAGGLANALSIHADEAFLELDSEHQAIAERMFRALTDRSSEHHDTRRPVPLEEVAAVAGVAWEEVAEVVEVFRRPGCSFITPPLGETIYPNTTLDISHESLIRQWTRLNKWVSEEADSARIYRRLEETARLWKAREAALWRTPDLENGLAWRENERPTAEWARRYGGDFGLAMGFLDESEKAHRAAELAEEAARRRELTLTRRVAAAVGVGAVIALIAAGFAIHQAVKLKEARDEVGIALASEEEQRGLAEVARDSLAEVSRQRESLLDEKEEALIEKDLALSDAQRERARAMAHELAAGALKNLYEEGDATRTLLLAMHAVSRSYQAQGFPEPAAGDALQRAVQATRATLHLSGHNGQTHAVAFSPDGRRLATAGTDTTVAVWDLETGTELVRLRGQHTHWVRDLAFEPSGEILATSSLDGSIGLWDSFTGRWLGSLSGHPGRTNAAVFSPAGDRLASVGADSTVRVWDIYSGQKLLEHKENDGELWAVAFSPDGRQIAVGGDGRSATILDATTGSELRTLRGHAWEVYGVAFSPDGKFLATGSRDQTVKIWDTATWRELHTLAGHTNTIFAVQFVESGEKTLLASASADRSVKLWDPGNGEEVMALSGHAGMIRDLDSYSASGRLASASDDGSAIVWEPFGNRDLVTLAGHNAQVWTAAYDTSGRTVRRLATADLEGRWKLWDLDTGRELFSSPDHTGAILSVAFSPDGRRAASGSVDKTAKLWDVASGAHLFTLSGHTDQISTVAFSPDGAQLATGSYDGTIRLWDTANGAELSAVSSGGTRVFQLAYSPDGSRLAVVRSEPSVVIWDLANRDSVALTGASANVVAVAFSPGGARVAGASRDGTVRLWDAATGQVRDSVVGHDDVIWDLAFSPDGRRLATASADGTVRLWDAGTGDSLRVLGRSDVEFDAVAFSRAGDRLAAVGEDRTVRVWDVESGEEVVSLSGHAAEVYDVAISPTNLDVLSGSDDAELRLWESRSNYEAIVLSAGHKWGILDIAFSPDGRRVATAGRDNRAKVWDASTGKILLTLADHTWSLNAVAFSPDGKLLATASRDSTARLWDAASGQVKHTLAGHYDEVRDVAFSPDGKSVITASMDWTARVWDVASGRTLRTLRGHDNWVNGVAFSPDGRLVATASQDGTAKLWNAGNGRLLRTLSGHTDAVREVAFRPDGEQVATASFDKTARVWDVRSGEELLALSGHSEWVTSVAFSPDGRQLATPSSDGTVILFASSVEGLLELGWRRVIRDMRSDECQRYLHQDEGCPASIASLVFEGKRLAANGQAEQAAARFARALAALPPFDVRAQDEATRLAAAGLVALGRNHARAGRRDSALVAFRRAVQLQPDLELDPEEETTKLQAAGLVARGSYLAKAGVVEGARESFEEAMKLDPSLNVQPEAETDKLAALGKADRLYHGARADDDVDGYREAIEAHESALSLVSEEAERTRLRFALVQLYTGLAETGSSMGPSDEANRATVLEALDRATGLWDELRGHEGAAGLMRELADATETVLREFAEYYLLEERDWAKVQDVFEWGRVQEQRLDGAFDTRSLSSDFSQRIVTFSFDLWQEGERQEGVLWATRATELDPRNSNAYVQVGYYKMALGDVEGASDSERQALRIDPDNAMANNNFGFLQLILGDFSAGTQYLRRAYELSPSMITAVNVGDAHQFQGAFELAALWHTLARDSADVAGPAWAGGTWVSNFLPEGRNDRETIRRSVEFPSRQLKKLFAGFALSIDHALLGDRSTAEAELAKLPFTPAGEYAQFFLNRIKFNQRIHGSRSSTADGWLKDKARWLSAEAAAAREDLKSLTGTWRGTVRQEDYGSYMATLTVSDGDTITTHYPTFGCGGELTLIGRTGQTLVFREQVERGRNLGCASGTWMFVTPLSRDSLRFAWQPTDVSGGTPGSGTLVFLSSALAQFEAAQTEANAGYWAAATSLYRQALASVRRQADRKLEGRIQLGLGLSRFNEGRVGDALAAWESAVALSEHLDSGDQATAFNNLAYAYSVENVNLDSAAVLISRAIEIGGALGNYLDTEAWIYFRQGRCDRALTPMIAARDSIPAGSDPEIDEHYVAIQCSCGDPQAAAETIAQWSAPPERVLQAQALCKK